MAQFIIHDKTNIKYQWIRISIDSIFVIVGFILGGVIGIGTIIGAFLTGTVMQFFMRRIDKIVKYIIYNEPVAEVAFK